MRNSFYNMGMTLPSSPLALFDTHRFCIAPMLDWTDRHCRFFHRQLSKYARLYTEMVTTGALIHGNQSRHLDFNDCEHPVALQVGGSDPNDLATVAKLAQRWGYDEINLNCGCPSERVQRGAFGACLMAEPRLVAQCVKAMRDATSLEVTVKHRIGLDDNDSLQFLLDFVGQVGDAGCSIFIVHARNAWLKGLSPKENREVPPLRYDRVAQLKKAFPHLKFVLNGGLTEFAQIEELLAPTSLPNLTPNSAPEIAPNETGFCDGVMVGRKAYHDPYWLAQVDQRLFGSTDCIPLRGEIVARMQEYIPLSLARGAPPKSASRHMIGLFNGLPRARLWRQKLSEPRWMDANPVEGLARALDVVMGSADIDKFNQGVWAEV